ncbi:MAG: LD-carboxypeptidase, partial [Pseudomonadota bacterium]
RIDRAIVQLRNAGLFDAAAGVVIGVMPGCEDPYNDLDELIVELLAPFGVPVVAGLASGHGQTNVPIRLNRAVAIDGNKGVLRLMPR